ncbi:hypothetical protein BD289DRAFT_21772 [Coniella lustricola]|uniref:Uncharacterized protein n=1 Tax=Coniella lustricola TaxID=2025994 RepID=A0A2T3A3P8_9PEZI|nr:hypothetical protein BD289DRAFT_21772 [Coniella lustricola]
MSPRVGSIFSSLFLHFSSFCPFGSTYVAEVSRIPLCFIPFCRTLQPPLPSQQISQFAYPKSCSIHQNLPNKRNTRNINHNPQPHPPKCKHPQPSPAAFCSSSSASPAPPHSLGRRLPPPAQPRRPSTHTRTARRPRRLAWTAVATLWATTSPARTASRSSSPARATATLTARRHRAATTEWQLMLEVIRYDEGR